MKNASIVCECDITHPESIELVNKHLVNDTEIELLANLFQMFSHPTRAKILLSLRLSELCVCDIAAIMNMTKSAVSHQLALLKKNKLVKSRRDGKNVYYSLDDEHVSTILDLGLEHVDEN